jgi:hypothetical protein
LKPLSQPNLGDLPLLFRGFLQFGVLVIFQAAPQNLQNLRRGRWSVIATTSMPDLSKPSMIC